MIVVRRIIRHKESKSAAVEGGNRYFNDMESVISHAKRQRKVFVYIDSKGNEGTIRSGRRMRTCDSHVKNTLQYFGQLPLPL